MAGFKLNSKYLENKIKRQIDLNGDVYVFNKYSVDEFHQKKDKPDRSIKIKGIFHEVLSNVKALSETEGARIINVPRSFILCLKKESEDIFLDDECIINNNSYKVIDKINVGNFNVAYDIVLELVKDEHNS